MRHLGQNKKKTKNYTNKVIKKTIATIIQVK